MYTNIYEGVQFIAQLSNWIGMTTKKPPYICNDAAKAFCERAHDVVSYGGDMDMLLDEIKTYIDQKYAEVD